MSKKFDAILNECLNRMAAGEDMEQCLVDHPDLLDDLRPLLETASKVKASGRLVQPRQEFRNLARQRILAEARAKAEIQRQSKWYAFWQWQYQWAMGVIAILLVLFVGGGTTVAASSNAMPDDFLYPVKLAVEDIRMTFAGSDVDKAELQAEFANRRIEEIAEMAEEGKWSKVEATAERLSDHLTKIVNVAEEKRIAGELKSDDVAKLMTTMTHYASDHPLIFRKAVEQMPPKEKAVIMKVFQMAKIQYAVAIEDLNIALRESTGQSVAIIAGTTTEVDGIVRMIADGKWVVGDQVVNVDDTTISNITHNVGAVVKVEAEVQADGSLHARKITARSSVTPSYVTPEVVRPTPVSSEDIPTIQPEKTATVDLTPSTSPVPDRTSAVTDVETKHSTEPTVKIIETPEEVLDVPEIRSFAGVIRKITNSHWMVGSYTVNTTNDTVIRGNPGVGQLARVWIAVQSDGSLLAHTIWVQESSDENNDIIDEVNSGSVENSTGNVSVEPDAGVNDNPEPSVQPVDDSNTTTTK